MNEKNETTGGEHNAEKPIKILRDPDTYIPGLNIGVKFDETMDKGEVVIKNIEELELTLPEALRLVEALTKQLGQLNNQTQQQIRTIKDKENQKIRDYFKNRYEMLVDMRDNPVSGLECPKSVRDEIINLEVYFKDMGKDIKDL